MPADYTIRRYRQGDELAVVESFQAAFSESLSARAWRWKYEPDQQPPSIILGELISNGTSEETSEIVSQYAAIPIAVTVGDRTINAGQPVDVFCLRRPGSTQQQIYLRCYEELVEQFCGPGRRYQVLFGFPNARALRQGQLQMGYPSDPPQVPVLTLSVAGRIRSRFHRCFPSALNQEEQACTAQDLDDLWTRSAHRYPVAVARDGAWLQRRFLSRPDVVYSHLVVRRDGQPRVWAAFRACGPVLQWVDLVWDGEASSDLLQANRLARRRALLGGHRSLQLWLMGDAEAESLFHSFGWTRNHQAELWFAHRFYDQEAEPEEPFAERFYVTMAVSDHV